MNVSVIIVNYNTASLLQQCVTSVVEKTHGVSYEIIVVDNGSREDELIPLRNDKRFTLLEMHENLGFGRANNAGASKSKGEHLLLLNPDTLLVNDAISILYKHLMEHPDTGICGGNIYSKDMKPAHSYHMLQPSILSEMDFACGQIYRRMRYGKNAQFNHTGKMLEVAMITGADMMVRREAWEKAKGFDPDFFMYCEDADLCLHIKNMGYGIVSIPEASIIHLEGKSFVESEAHCQRILDGRFKYFKKHHSPIYNKVADILNIASLMSAVTICKLLQKEQRCKNYQQRLRIYRTMAKHSAKSLHAMAASDQHQKDNP